ncbi:MAG TPA: hypothetical protein VM307_16170 [Egibacteraceae bacterium]|nr:hypothetical protein [Egibacteraceae bacterium]
MEKKAYTEPDITDLGTVTDLTETGNTHPGDDIKGGSRPSNANPN